MGVQMQIRIKNESDKYIDAVITGAHHFDPDDHKVSRIPPGETGCLDLGAAAYRIIKAQIQLCLNYGMSNEVTLSNKVYDLVRDSRDPDINLTVNNALITRALNASPKPKF